MSRATSSTSRRSPSSCAGLGYSLQANAKTREGASHPDRDAQFRQISQTVQAALKAGEPAISVDAKKRELVGDFKAVGRELAPKGRPVEVRTHDFKDKQLGHAIPYAILDLTRDEGWVSVGIDSNTAQWQTWIVKDRGGRELVLVHLAELARATDTTQPPR